MAKLCAHGKKECPYCGTGRHRPANRCASCSRVLRAGQRVCAQCVECGFDPQELPIEPDGEPAA